MSVRDSARSEPAFPSREAAELTERRQPTYVHLSAAPRGPATLIAWFAALLLVLATVGFALYANRHEHFVIANGGYVLRLNRITGKACYIPADPEWERVLEGRQALLDRCPQ